MVSTAPINTCPQNVTYTRKISINQIPREEMSYCSLIMWRSSLEHLISASSCDVNHWNTWYQPHHRMPIIGTPSISLIMWCQSLEHLISTSSCDVNHWHTWYQPHHVMSIIGTPYMSLIMWCQSLGHLICALRNRSSQHLKFGTFH